MYDEKIDYNVIVARQEDTYYSLDYVFRTAQYQGAVGSRLRPVSRAERDERMEPENVAEYLEEAWRGAVQAESTTDSLSEWAEGVVDVDGDETIFDLSYFEQGKEAAKLFNAALPEDHYEDEEAEFSECVGGGRCFHKEDTWDEVFRPDLMEVIWKYEGEGGGDCVRAAADSDAEK